MGSLALAPAAIALAPLPVEQAAANVGVRVWKDHQRGLWIGYCRPFGLMLHGHSKAEVLAALELEVNQISQREDPEPFAYRLIETPETR